MESTTTQTAGNSTLSRSIAALELSERAQPGIARISAFRQPVLHRALLFVACYSLIVGVLQYVYKTGHISAEFKNLYAVFLYLFLFAGALNITGCLTPGRFALILINIAMFQTWETVFYNNAGLKVYYFFFASWLILWWTWREPEMMNRLGLRKSGLIRDVLIGFMLSLLVLAYMVFVANKFGFPASYKLRDIALHASIMLPQNLVTYNFLFALWNELQKRGISQAESILVLTFLIILLVAPQAVAFYAAGAVSPGICAGTIFMSTLLFVLLVLLTFRTMRNTFPAACVSTAAIEALVMIGIL